MLEKKEYVKEISVDEMDIVTYIKETVIEEDGVAITSTTTAHGVRPDEDFSTHPERAREFMEKHFTPDVVSRWHANTGGAL